MRKKEWQSARQRGDVAALKAMLTSGADIDALDEHGQTALMLAAREGQAEVVALLVQRGASLDTTAKYHLSALMLAALNGREEAALLLVAAGADPGVRGSGAPGFSGKTALDLARDAGHARLAELLGA